MEGNSKGLTVSDGFRLGETYVEGIGEVLVSVDEDGVGEVEVGREGGGDLKEGFRSVRSEAWGG